MALSTLDEFISVYCVEDGMLANANSVNRSPIQLKKEIDEVNFNLNNTKNSNQVLDSSDAIQAIGKVISVKKGDGSVESVTLDLFDSKMDKISSVSDRIPRFDGTNGNLKLSTSSIDDFGNFISTGSITSNTGVLNGNSTTTSKLKTARLIGGVSFDGTSDINLPGVNITGNQNTTGNASTSTAAEGSSFFTNGSGVENQVGVKLLGQSDVYLFSNATQWGVFSQSGGAAFQYTRSTGILNFNGNANTSTNTSGNSGTTTKLKTARLIGGIPFDGSADINLPGVNMFGSQGTSGNAGSATRLQNGRLINGIYFDGTSDITIRDVGTVSAGGPSGGIHGDIWYQY